MLEKIYITESTHTDLNIYRCGFEDCSSGHSWGPAVRDHYIIHYVLGGKGIFLVGGNTYRLEKNNGFLICPDTPVFYQADGEDPWSYSWVGFQGLKAEKYLAQAGLGKHNPIFRYDRDEFLKECLNKMISSRSMQKGREIYMLGLLYEFLSQLVELAGNSENGVRMENRKEDYVKKAVEYIRTNYWRKLSIAEAAKHVGLDRSYLYLLFNEYLRTSPHDFLTHYRIDRACSFMKNSNLSIGDISRSVGYEDPLLFSKVFKKVKGISPRDYRSCHRDSNA